MLLLEAEENHDQLEMMQQGNGGDAKKNATKSVGSKIKRSNAVFGGRRLGFPGTRNKPGTPIKTSTPMKKATAAQLKKYKGKFESTKGKTVTISKANMRKNPSAAAAATRAGNELWN